VPHILAGLKGSDAAVVYPASLVESYTDELSPKFEI